MDEPKTMRWTLDQSLKAVAAAGILALAGAAALCAVRLGEIERAVYNLEVGGGEGGAVVLADAKLIAEMKALNETMSAIEMKQPDNRDALMRAVAPTRPAGL